MKIEVKSSCRIVIEIDDGKRYEVSTEELISSHLYVRHEDQTNMLVSGFTDRTVELGSLRGVKVA